MKDLSTKLTEFSSEKHHGRRQQRREGGTGWRRWRWNNNPQVNASGSNKPTARKGARCFRFKDIFHTHLFVGSWWIDRYKWDVLRSPCQRRSQRMARPNCAIQHLCCLCLELGSFFYRSQSYRSIHSSLSRHPKSGRDPIYPKAVMEIQENYKQHTRASEYLR